MKNYKILLFSCLCLFSILFFGCTHEDGKLPKVKTGNVSFNVHNFLATGLVNANGTTVTRAGFCYSTTNKKPDINDYHTPNAANASTIEDYLGQNWVITGSQPIAEYCYCGDMNVGPDNNIVYVRAYAMTADGRFVYGETVKARWNDDNNLCYLLTRPNGWKLTSIVSDVESLPFHEGDVMKFNENETGIYVNDFRKGYWSLSDEIDEYFFNGNSEYHSSNYYFQFTIDQYPTISGYGFGSEVFEITPNELIIHVIYGDDAPVDLRFVPAP